MSASPALGRSISTAAAASYIRVDVTRAYAPARCSASRLPYRSTENIHLTSTSVHARNHAASFTDETARSRESASVASELWGQGVHCTAQVQDLYPLYLPSQRCGLCQNFKQTTLTTRLHKVRTKLYPPLTKTFRRAWVALFWTLTVTGCLGRLLVTYLERLSHRQEAVRTPTNAGVIIANMSRRRAEPVPSNHL